MGIERSRRRVAERRIRTIAGELLEASTLCAIATVAPSNRAHVSTAYFAWGPEFELVWLSEPHARHSRNIRGKDTVAIAVYDSTQAWGEPDRGIQLFGSARPVDGSAARDAEMLYANRFPRYSPSELGAYRAYGFRPRRLKLFDERALGTGVFVTATVGANGRLAWERTEIYRQSV